jgi:hypothetical protein
MSMYQDKSAPVRRISDVTPEQVAAHVREARRLRQQAVAAVLRALVTRARRKLPLLQGGTARKAAVGRSL